MSSIPCHPSLPEVYPCSEIQNDSSALKSFCSLYLSFLGVLKSEFSSNLVALTISDLITLIHIHDSSCNLNGVVPKSIFYKLLSPSVFSLCLHLFTAHMSNVCLIDGICHVAHNFRHYSKLTIVHLFHHWFYLFHIVNY